MTRRSVTVALALTALPYSANAQSEGSDPEKVAAHRDHHVCLYRAAQSLDDGRSDAASIAQGIMPMCAEEWMRLMNLYARSMSPRAFAVMATNVAPTRLSDATRAVLTYRASKRKSSN